MSKPSDLAKATGGGKPPLLPALECKLQHRAQAGGQALRRAAQQPPRGARAVRAIRHQGR